MTTITFEGGTISVDPAVVASGLRLDPDTLRDMLRSGLVTSVCEKGEDEDAGRFRLTFYSPNRRFRLIVDAAGVIVQSSTVDYRRRGNAPA
jgi:hypothetical protein